MCPDGTWASLDTPAPGAHTGQQEGWGAGYLLLTPLPLPAPLAPDPVTPPLPSSSPWLLWAGADLNRLAGSQELIILMQCKMECA